MQETHDAFKKELESSMFGLRKNVRWWKETLVGEEKVSKEEGYDFIARTVVEFQTEILNTILNKIYENPKVLSCYSVEELDRMAEYTHQADLIKVKM